MDALTLSRAQYIGISLVPLRIEIKDELIEARMNSLLAKASRKQLANETLQAADEAKISYTCHDPEEFVGLSGEAVVAIGSKEHLEPLERSLTGRRVGDRFVVTIAYPKTYAIETLEGKTLEMGVDVLSASRLGEYELSDSFVSAISEFDGVSEFRSAIEAQFEEENKQESRRYFIAQIEEKLASAVDVPGIEGEVGRRFAEISPDRCLDEEVEAELMASIRNDVLVKCAVESIAHAENIGISANEVEAELQGLVSQGFVQQSLSNSQKVLDSIQSALLREKVFDFVIANAVFAEVGESDAN